MCVCVLVSERVRSCVFLCFSLVKVCVCMPVWAQMTQRNKQGAASRMACSNAARTTPCERLAQPCAPPRSAPPPRAVPVCAFSVFDAAENRCAQVQVSKSTCVHAFVSTHATHVRVSARTLHFLHPVHAAYTTTGCLRAHLLSLRVMLWVLACGYRCVCALLFTFVS